MTHSIIADYNFSGNLEDLLVSSATADEIVFTLKKNGATLFKERYMLSGEVVKIPLSSIMSVYADVAVPEGSNDSLSLFTYSLDSNDEDESSVNGTFYCVKGGHSSGVADSLFFKNNWLTWQPQTQTTLYHTPRYLSYVALVACTVKIKGYFADGTSLTVLHSSFIADTINTIDATYGTLCELFDEQPTYVDLWVEGTGFCSYPQRFMLTAYIDNTDAYLWVNSLGGIDTVLFSGELNSNLEYASSIAALPECDYEFDVDNSVIYTKNTGYLKGEELRLWIRDFFNSQQKYYLLDGSLSRIVIKGVDGGLTRNKIGGYSFDYCLAKESIYLNLARTNTPTLLSIISPADEVFSLAPRLNEFAGAKLDEGEVYLPCQYAHELAWRKITVADIINGVSVSYLKEILTHPAEWSVDISLLPSDLATKKYVEDYIASLDLSTPSVDLTNYYTKTQSDARFALINGDLTKPFNAKSLALNGAITGVTDITASGNGTFEGNLYAMGVAAFESGEGNGSGLDSAALYSYLTSAKTTNGWLSGEYIHSSYLDLSGYATTSALTTALATKLSSTDSRITQWSTAYSWGDHSTVGYVLGTDSRLTNSRPASDVAAWAKALTKPSYTWSEIGSKPSWIGSTKPTYTAAEVGALSAITKTMVEEVLTGNITSHTHSYLPLSGGTISGALLMNDPSTTTDWNSIWQSGFFQGDGATNAPTSFGWYWGINMGHSSNTSGIKYGAQFIMKNEFATDIPRAYIRNRASDGTGVWRELYHSGNLTKTTLGLGNVNNWGASSSVESTSTTTYATSAAVKSAYDLASTKLNASAYTAADVLTKIKTVDGSGSGLDADLLDGLHASAFAFVNASYPLGSGNSVTTDEFVEILREKGMFDHSYSIMRCSWYYAGQVRIIDTGLGVIGTAGCVIEVWNQSGYTIKITTPTTSSEGTTNAEFIYVNNGSIYSPGWRRSYNSKNANLISVDWSAKNLALNGAITGVTDIIGSSSTRIGVGGGDVQLVYHGDFTKSVALVDGSFKPTNVASGLIDLGLATARWKGIYGNTLSLNGAITGATNITASGNGTFGGNLYVLGVAAFEAGD